jgi:hypothetical protein
MLCFWSESSFPFSRFTGETVSKLTEHDALSEVFAEYSAADIDDLIAVLDRVLHIVPEKAG